MHPNRPWLPVLWAAAVLVPALAQAPAQPRVNCNFRQIEIHRAMQMLTELTGVEFIVGKDVQGSLTASFVDKPLDEVLQVVSVALGLELQRVGDAWLVKAKPKPAAVPGAAPADAVPKVSIKFERTDIRDALKQMTEKTGIDFVVADGVRGSITAEFENKPLDEVLKSIATMVNAEVTLVEGVFIFRPAKPTADQTLPPREGAGALLPGTAPKSVLDAKGDAASLLPPVTAGAEGGAKGKPVRTTIPVENLSPAAIARILGVGWIDGQGRYHSPDEGQGAPTQPAAGANNPYANLPPRSRVTQNGTILLPNGTTILPSGVVIGPDGSIYMPRGPSYYSVPWGTNLRQGPVVYQDPNQPVLGGTISGVPFQLTQGGQLSLLPPTIGGAAGQLILPPVTLGPGGIQQGLPRPPVIIQQGPTILPPNGAPNVHFGQRPTDWFYGLPPDWHFTPPPG
ncbi:MAG: hypothetical protein HYU66_26615 [Armatimonadetes bacterium]|nr:hypothetical protein [Armatimonadota bacterium]